MLLLIGGCATTDRSPGSAITVVGSDTMLLLNRRLAETFMRNNPGVSVRVFGGGSGAGVRAVTEGQADVCAASRPLAPDEVQAIYDRFKTLGVRFLVAQDALSVYLNVANPVTALSMDQLKRIFDGTIVDWAEAGGRHGEVMVVVRPPNSGSYRFFRDHVLSGGAFSSSAVTAPTTREVLETVRTNPSAVGFGGVAYTAEGVRTAEIDGVGPSATGRPGRPYPLTRYLVFYTVRPPSGLAREFIDWCLGPEGQRVVAEVGYAPLWSQ
jgi:phosphate transport system substrate-binding protein